jgi:acetylornithine deacetylase/succinyl-diaminopimelate desuccinylase-like protein
VPVRGHALVRRRRRARRGGGLTLTGAQLDRDFLRDTLLELARVPTDVPLGFDTLIEPDDPKLVRYVQEEIRPRLVAEGADDLVDAGRNNLVARFGSGEVDATLLIQSYTPTQHHNLMDRPFEPRIVDGAPYGRDEPVVVAQGVSQCKAHQAVMLAVVRLLRSHGTPLRGRLYWAVNNEGRSSHDCTSAILDTLDRKPQFALLQVDEAMRISLGNRGRVDVDVTVHGRTTHSSTPEDGLSAIDGVAEVVRRVQGLSWADEHPLLGARHAHVYKLELHPVAPHTVPGQARLTVDRRLLPGDDPDTATAEITEALSGMAPFEVSVERGVTMLPSLLDPSDPWLRSLRGVVAETRGTPAPEVINRGCFDAGGTTSRGIPTASFGAGGDGHWPTGDDAVALADVEHEALVLAQLILSRLA